ncbi:MAG: hypothetical protein ACFFE3_12925, partial [Candidatus Thorarchaeota archaeon]
MKPNYKHAFIIIALSFLLSAPVVSAANAGAAVVAQDIGEEFFFDLIQNGAEVVAAMIGPQGEPAVVYGQLGVPSAQLGLEQSGPGQMYEGCVVTALIATHGELLDYVMDLVGPNLFNFSGAGDGDFMITQFGEGGFGFDSIFDMLGTDFSLLIDVFVDLDNEVAQANMAAIRTHLQTQFGFSFAELLNLRIDEEFIEGIIGEPVELPFRINIFIYQVTNPFEDAVNSVFDVMDQTGFLASIDSSVFTDARASGAGILAIPDMGDLMDLIEGFGGNSTPTPTSFMLSQMPELDGPIAIAAAGYIGDQEFSTSSDEIKIFEDLLGKSPSQTVNGLSSGQSLVAAFVPVNVTSYSPEDEALNRTFYDSSSGVVFWNASYYTNQPDYILNFEPGSFPPLVKFVRSFDPDTTTIGGSTTVTVSVHNEDTVPITNVSVVDNMIGTTYTSVTVSGTQSANTALLDGGNWFNTTTYTVTFPNEGGYAFAPAIMSYEYNGTTYYKQTHIDGFTVSS